MLSKKTMGWTAVVVGILIALTEGMGWNGSWNYLWAVLVAVWGLMSLGK